MTDNWTPEEIAAIDARAEQQAMAVEDVDRFASPALSLSEGAEKLRVKLRFFLQNHRLRMSIFPVVEDGVLGGRDGNATAGNPNATYFAPRGSGFLPTFAQDDPSHRRTPIIVISWNLDHEWIVRTPHRIEDVLQGFVIEWGTPCDWHMGKCRLDAHGASRSSLLVLTSGQYIVLVLVCASCRDRLAGTYGDGLRWLDLDNSGRVALGDNYP